jgi:hypothetical protein
VLLVNLAPHFPTCVRILSLPKRFSLAFQLDRAVESMRLRILAFWFVFNPLTALPLSWVHNVRGTASRQSLFLFGVAF